VLTKRGPARLAERRFRETLGFLRAQGIAAEQVVDLAAETGVADGDLANHLLPTFQALLARLAGAGVTRVVTPAWEGGHIDHDMSAGLALALSEALGPGVEAVQYCLYHGRDTRGQVFSGGAPLPEGGPVERLPLTRRQWLGFAAAFRHFPSQMPVWSTLWPAMFIGYARNGYGVQRLTRAVLAARPHPGSLLYERRGRGRYEDARAALDAFEVARG
jgi:hypothetical protein